MPGYMIESLRLVTFCRKCESASRGRFQVSKGLFFIYHENSVLTINSTTNLNNNILGERDNLKHSNGRMKTGTNEQNELTETQENELKDRKFA